MSDFLTTRELAVLLRVKERKVYELAAAGTLPVRRVTGKLLFPREEIETWLGTRSGETPVMASVNGKEAGRPAVVVGSHDPLLEWALRESRSGIATFLDGALDGLDRAAAGECVAAGLHIPEGSGWNVASVADRFGKEPWVLIEWARRTRGLVMRTDLARKPRSLRDAKGLRLLCRQPEAGSELIFSQLLACEKLRPQDFNLVGMERSESDLVSAIAANRADIGLGLAASARQFGLDFVPLVNERFDLLIWRKAYFDQPFQKFVKFCALPAFHAKAEDLGGYDISGFGTVHFNGS
ncbi:substrate-binding domain-containing protein [Rhodomicrobium sp.]|uniref:substrate-binding domain-containing protein n=1 Tax=Rhodomicrobium sp. TaxID=2720632 RepID=UPI0039E3F794